jgi:hypothetical protein
MVTGFAVGAALKRVPVWVWVGLAALVAFYFALDAYGDRRYGEGKKDEAAAWQKASDKLIAQAAQASDKADTKAAERAADYAVKVEDEKEKIDAAIADGSSPLDVLFGG